MLIPNESNQNDVSPPVLLVGRCPVCGDGMQQSVRCLTCETPHHEDCWQYNQGCAVYGCTKVTVIVDEPKALVVQGNTGLTRRLGATMVEWTVMGLFISVVVGLFPETLACVLSMAVAAISCWAVVIAYAKTNEPPDANSNAVVPHTTNRGGFAHRFVCNFVDNVRRGLEGNYHGDEDDWDQRNQ